MPRIEYIDYRDLEKKAKEIRTHAGLLNNELTSAYKSIIDMNKAWYGRRYNSLAEDFNKLAPAVNDMLEVSYGEIPFALETIANNFSQADQGSNITSAQKTAEKKMPNVPKPDKGNEMRFMTTEVSNTNQNVLNNFKKANAEMNELERIFKSIRWQSESQEAFTRRFTTLKKQITEEIENIKKNFAQLMQQALDDMKKTEQSNTVK